MSDILARFSAAFSASQDTDAGLVQAREARRQDLLAGAFPTISELLAGYPLSCADITRDVGIWASTEALKPYVQKNTELGRQLQAVVDNPCRWTVLAIDDEILHHKENVRRHYYLALMGDEAARWQTVRALMSRHFSTWLDQIMGVSLAFHIARLRQVGHDDFDDIPPYISEGIDHLSMMPLYDLEVERYRTALDAVEGAKRSQAENDADAVVDEVSDLAAMSSTAEPVIELPKAATGWVVVPAFETPKTKTGDASRKALRDTFRPIAGSVLPFITRGDVGAHRNALTARSPHLVEVLDTMLSDLAAKDAVRFLPTILVGEPGAGKSAVARDICRQIGLPMTVYSAGGVSDASFAGTPAQWSTSGPSVPLQLVRDARVANPCIIVDEIDKVATGSANGSLSDALLNFLDRGNAAVVRDPALEMAVDLSHVNWILTANSLNDIPRPLRDRCRILEVPNPSWNHVGDLVKTIICDLASERDLHPNWIAPLDGDELSLVRKAWNGGSIRKLRRVIEVLVAGRDIIMPRC